MTVEDFLKATGLEPTDNRILIAHALQWSRVQLITNSREALTPQQITLIGDLFRRRLNGEPIAYLTGQREFYGLNFEVTPAVLIPRPDTELLVELSAEHLPSGGSALDLGTGSGAIAVALAHLRADAQIAAADISTEALHVAQRNAHRHGTAVRFIHSDWYASIRETFDLIVSNPPYIARDDPHLLRGDLRFEPAAALTDHANGMTAITHIVAGAPPYLRPGGWLLVEHGYDQATAARELFARQEWADIQSWRDLAGIERVSGARRPQSA